MSFSDNLRVSDEEIMALGWRKTRDVVLVAVEFFFCFLLVKDIENIYSQCDGCYNG